MTVSVDGSVLDRIAKIMTYLRLGSSGKVLKKKKKEKDARGNYNLRVRIACRYKSGIDGSLIIAGCLSEKKLFILVFKKWNR